MPLNRMNVTVEINGREQNLTIPANRPFIIGPETPWAAKWPNNIRAISVFVKRRILAEIGDELFGGNIKSIEILSKVAIEDRGMACLLHALKEALYEPKGDANLKVEYISRALAADVLRKHSVPLHERPIVQDPLTAKQTKLVIDYIQQHLSSKILLKDLTALAGLSQTNFIRRFNASLGVSPHRYVMEVRINRARKLLEKSNLPIVEIAAQCGFSDQAHLTVAFKRIAGMTPARYRQIIS